MKNSSKEDGASSPGEGRWAMRPAKGLNRREFDEVIRRAAELAAKSQDGGEDVLTEAEVFRIAREAGLQEEYVQRALAEVRSAPRPPAGVVDRWYGPSCVRVVRVVKGTPAELGRTLEDFFLGTQLLRSIRSTRTVQVYRRARDLGSELARAFSSLSRNSPLANAEGVSVRLEPLGEDRTLVEIEVEPGLRARHLGAGLGGGLAGGMGLGLGVGVALAAGGLGGLSLLVAGLAAGGVLGAALWLSVRAHRGRLEEIRLEAEGILDRLDAGAPVAPAPAPWRHWVRRGLDGLARDLLGRGG